MNVQLVPEPFVEIPVELANEMGIKGGERVKVSSARGQLRRQGDGHAAHQADDDRRQEDLSDRHPDSLGLSRHRGGRGPNALDSANLLSPTVDRSQRVHAGVQRLPGEAGEGA